MNSGVNFQQEEHSLVRSTSRALSSRAIFQLPTGFGVNLWFSPLLIAVIGLACVWPAAGNEGLSEGSVSEDESWPQWRGPGRDGKAASTGLLREWPEAGPTLLWSSEGAGSGYASVSIAEGKIFTTGNANGKQNACCFDLESGDLIWTTAVTERVPDHGYKGSRTTPTYDDGHIYLVTSDGQIACLDASTGSAVWSRSFDDWGGKMMSGWGFSESPLVDGDWVLCTPGSDDAAIVALEKLTGDEVWSAAVPEFGDRLNRGGRELRSGAGYSSIVISEAAGVKQYIQVLGQGIIGVRASNGQFLWGYDDVVNNVANIPTPIVSGDQVFCSTGYGTGSALLQLSADRNGVKAEEVYFLEARTLQNHHGGLILKDGYIYGGHGHNNGFPICVKMSDGEIAWGGNERGAGNGSAAVLFVDNMLIFRYQNGPIALVEATSERYNLVSVFTPEFQEAESWAHPVVVDGRLYLREQDKLMCYDLRSSPR